MAFSELIAILLLIKLIEDNIELQNYEQDSNILQPGGRKRK